MRFRFSLRTFFLLLALFAVACYLWLTRPSQLAAQFAGAINSENYQAADRLFRRSADHFLAEWADDRWAFQARCDVRPLTFTQVLFGRRHVDVHITYFELDHSASRHAETAGTPWGMSSPSISTVEYGGMFIDTGGTSQMPIERR
jgi:hypothetical protein